MSIKDMKHVTVEQVLALRDEAIKVEEQRDQLAEALSDMLSGWRYVREMHGDLYGVGWDRAEDKARAALKAMEDE